MNLDVERADSTDRAADHLDCTFPLLPSESRRARDTADPRLDVRTLIIWPKLQGLGLPSDQLQTRHRFIGGSDANIILSGDEARITRLWEEKRGLRASEDLSHVLAVMLGCWTEEFNRLWFEQETGLVVEERSAVWVSIEHPWRRATLDGLVGEKAAVWEAKHVSAFAKADEVLARYMPQLQHNMAVAGLETAILSVIYGNHKWESYEIASDWLYQDALLAAEQRFWDCVQAGTPPVAVAAPEPPKPIDYREICLEGNNAWAVAAGLWRENAAAAKQHAGAVKALKELIPDDASRAWGHGLEAKRSKSGAISFKEVA